MNKLATLKRSWVGLSALVLGVGCQAQVSDEYRGEVLLTLRGSVVIDAAAATDQVPVLVFWNSPSSLLLIDAEVSGEFPSRFRMDITEPPPASTFTEASSIENGMRVDLGLRAIGFLAVVPKDHPREVAIPTEEVSNIECSDNVGSCSYLHRICIAPDQCIEREDHCTATECPVIAEYGEPIAREDVVSGDAFGEGNQNGLLWAHMTCNAAGDCYRRFTKCDQNEFYGAYYQSSDYGLSCETVSESGDPRAKAFNVLLKSAIGYDLLYLPEAMSQSPIGIPLSAGYHVTREELPATDQEWVDGVICRNERPTDTTCSWPARPVLVQPDEELTIRLGARHSSQP